MSLTEVAVLEGHTDRVWHASWHPTRQLIATCGGDKTVRIWAQIEGTWRCTAILDEATSRTIRACEWSRCGKFIGAVSFDASVVIWEQTDTNTYEPLATLEGHENEVKNLCWSPDGTWLATCGRDKSIWIWDADPDHEFECVTVLHGHSQDVKCVKFHPSSLLLASASYDDTIRLWKEDEDEDWSCDQVLSGHSSTVWDLAFNHAGTKLASCSDDCNVIVWSNEHGTWKRMTTLQGYQDRTIFSVDWCANDETFATGSADDSICVFGQCTSQGDLNQNSYELVYRKQTAHEGDVNCVRWCPHEPHLLVSTGDDNIVRLWQFSL